MKDERPVSPWMLWLTIIAAPAALGFETGLRLLLFPADFELIREFLNPTLTPVAWLLGAVAALASFGGLFVQRRLAEKRLSALPPDASFDLRYRAVFGVFLLTTAIPQIPAIFSTLTFMFGASLIPVLVGIGVSSVGVVSQALRVESIARGPG